jgi:hypothetical protein
MLRMGSEMVFESSRWIECGSWSETRCVFFSGHSMEWNWRYIYWPLNGPTKTNRFVAHFTMHCLLLPLDEIKEMSLCCLRFCCRKCSCNQPLLKLN